VSRNGPSAASPTTFSTTSPNSSALAGQSPFSRLTRLAQIWCLRLSRLDDERLDRVEGDGWTLRRVGFHLDNTYYADAVGNLSSRHEV
jgi:hypothetical protein